VSFLRILSNGGDPELVEQIMNLVKKPTNNTEDLPGTPMTGFAGRN